MSLPSERSYTLEKSPEPPMAREEYESLMRREWADLLAADPEEATVQSFLERHPCMVPRVGHQPRWPMLVSQPRLPGWSSKVPDFLWIADDSLAAYAVLIEIEKPSKPRFRADGGRTHYFTQAQDQLSAWRAWFA